MIFNIAIAKKFITLTVGNSDFGTIKLKLIYKEYL